MTRKTLFFKLLFLLGSVLVSCVGYANENKKLISENLINTFTKFRPMNSSMYKLMTPQIGNGKKIKYFIPSGVIYNAIKNNANLDSIRHEIADRICQDETNGEYPKAHQKSLKMTYTYNIQRYINLGELESKKLLKIDNGVPHELFSTLICMTKQEELKSVSGKNVELASCSNNYSQFNIDIQNKISSLNSSIISFDYADSESNSNLNKLFEKNELHQSYLKKLNYYLKMNNEKMTRKDGNVLSLEIDPFLTHRGTSVKRIYQDSYDGPRTSDFLNRLQIVSEASAAYLASKHINDSESILKKITEKYRRKLLIGANLDWKRLEREMRIGKSDHFMHKFFVAETFLKQFVQELVQFVSNKTNSKFTEKDLAYIENLYVTNRGRNNIVHIYDVSNDLGMRSQALYPSDKSTFISVNYPFNQFGPVQNSALRDRAGLANAVETSFHKVGSNGGIETLFSGYRHSAYNPIEIRDKMQRVTIAVDNMKQMLEQIVKNEISKTGKCPREINLATMTIMTPVVMDEKFRGKTSEEVQVEESYFASRIFDGSEIEINGCKVIPKTTFMNIGANKGDVIAARYHLQSKFQFGINAKGFIDFDQALKDSLWKGEQVIKTYLQSMHLLRPFESAVYDLFHDISELNHLYANETQSVSDYLVRAYSVLDEIKPENQEFDRVRKNPDGLEHLERAYKRIIEKEKKLHEIYLAIEDKYKESYREKRSNLRDKETRLLAKLNNLIRELNKNGSVDDINGLLELMIRQRDLLQLYSENRLAYFNKDFNRWEYKLDFQRNYLLANFLMGKHVEFFCKSAEDRTGRLNNKLEEALIYYSKYGEFPYYSDKLSQQRIKKIAERVYHGGSSRDTTDANNPGARGLQIGNDGDYGVRAKIDKTMGGLAKSIYKKLE